MEKACHSYRSEIVFADTDASGWVHFSQILIFAERAEHDFLRRIGIQVHESGKGGWPRVHISCDYKCPLKFQDEIEVEIWLEEIGKTSLKWVFKIYKKGKELAAEGSMVTVKMNEFQVITPITEQERQLLNGRL